MRTNLLFEDSEDHLPEIKPTQIILLNIMEKHYGICYTKRK